MYKQSDIIKDCIKFDNKIEKLKLYLIEVNKNNIIKNKIYLYNYIINGKNDQLIIIII